MWIPGKVRGLALEVFLMFIFYLVIYFLDMYKDWDILVGDLREEDEKDENNTSKSDFDNHSNSENKNFDKKADECKNQKKLINSKLPLEKLKLIFQSTTIKVKVKLRKIGNSIKPKTITINLK